MRARKPSRQARAQVERDSTNLRYSVIRSPISGVVVARNVDVGRPSLPVSRHRPCSRSPRIARHADRLQRLRADVGAITVGDKVRFTVDAFPERDFVGRCGRSLNPTVQQNVVTYNVWWRWITKRQAHAGHDGAREDSGGGAQGCAAHPNAALRFKPVSNEEASEKKPRAKKNGDGPTVFRLGRTISRPR